MTAQLLQTINTQSTMTAQIGTHSPTTMIVMIYPDDIYPDDIYPDSDDIMSRAWLCESDVCSDSDSDSDSSSSEAESESILPLPAFNHLSLSTEEIVILLQTCARLQILCEYCPRVVGPRL